MSANLCLVAWNEPIGDAELHPLLGVLQRHVEDRLRGADHLHRERDRGFLDRAPKRRSRRTAVTEDAVRGDAHAIEADVREAPAAVERPDGRARGGRTRNHDGAHAVVARAGIARDHDDLVDCVTFDDVAVFAVQHDVGAVGLHRHRRARRVE